jgi:hypothetical protein
MRAGPRVSREERFFEKVKRSDGCWEWLAKKNNKGYGMFGGTKAEGFSLAHRVSYEFARGKIPKGKWALHSCDNRGCVNPDHLFLGRNIDNVQDMHRKGRGWGGIGPAVAYAILWQWAAGDSRRKIAREYNVSMHAVKHIALRQTWRSLSQSHD